MSEPAISQFDDYVPEHLRSGLRRYFADKVKPGGFLSAILQNDLARAVAIGDTTSLAFLVQIVTWLNHWAPPGSWGSHEKFNRWLENS